MNLDDRRVIHSTLLTVAAVFTNPRHPRHNSRMTAAEAATVLRALASTIQILTMEKAPKTPDFPAADEPKIIGEKPITIEELATIANCLSLFSALMSNDIASVHKILHHTADQLLSGEGMGQSGFKALQMRLEHALKESGACDVKVMSRGGEEVPPHAIN